jgi:hypothetical protein
VLTFGVELFLVLSVPCGRSARAWRTVRGHSVRFVFFVFLLVFVFNLLCFRVLVGRGFGRSVCTGRTVRGCLADSPRAPPGRSVIRGAALLVRRAFSDSPRVVAGRSAGSTRTIRTGFCSSELVLRFLFVSFRFLSLGFLVIPLRLFEPYLGSCLCVWVRGVAIGV